MVANLVADDTADCCAAYRADCTAAGQDRAANGTYASADRRILVLLRHPAAGTQAEQDRGGNRAQRKPMHRFHGNTLQVNVTNDHHVSGW